MGRRVGRQAAMIITFTSSLLRRSISNNSFIRERANPHAFQISRFTVIPSALLVMTHSP